MAKIYIPNKEPIIRNKEDIIEVLKTYKKIISEELFDYLIDLLNINNSCLEERFNEEELSLIEKIPVFDDITLYNIYYLVKEYINLHPEVLLDEQVNNIKLYKRGLKKRKLFDLYFNQTYDTRKQEVNFYSEVIDQKYYDDLDKQISNDLMNELKKENPYGYEQFRYGGPASNWQFDHEEKIKKLESELKDIRSRNIPNNEEKEQIKIMQEYNKSLMEYFKISDQGFKLTREYGSNRNKKVLTKNINGIQVYDNIKYI
jgi:hypothetical protein